MQELFFSFLVLQEKNHLQTSGQVLELAAQGGG